MLRRAPPISATIGATVCTICFPFLDNVVAARRRPSPEPQLAADPLPPPRQQPLLPDDDDDARPSILNLILRLLFAGTDSVEVSR